MGGGQWTFGGGCAQVEENHKLKKPLGLVDASGHLVPFPTYVFTAEFHNKLQSSELHAIYILGQPLWEGSQKASNRCCRTCAHV